MACAVRWDPAGGRGMLPGLPLYPPDTGSPVPEKAGPEYQARVGIRKAARQRPNVPNVFCSGTEAASREMTRGSGLRQLLLQAGLSVSFPGGSLIPDNPSSLHMPEHFTKHFHALITLIPGHPHNSPEPWSLNSRRKGAQRG